MVIVTGTVTVSEADVYIGGSGAVVVSGRLEVVGATLEGGPLEEVLVVTVVVGVSSSQMTGVPRQSTHIVTTASKVEFFGNCNKHNSCHK